MSTPVKNTIGKSPDRSKHLTMDKQPQYSSNETWRLVKSFSWLLAIAVVYFSVYFEDVLYAAYMGPITQDLVLLQALTQANPHLSSSFNQILCEKSALYQNTLQAAKHSSSNFITRNSLLKVTIKQPIDVSSTIVTSNIVQFSIEGAAVMAEQHLAVNVVVTLDGHVVDLTNVMTASPNKQDYSLTLDNMETGAHKLEITVTIPKVSDSLSLDKAAQQSKMYLASTQQIFFYLNDSMDNSAALNQLITETSRNLLGIEPNFASESENADSSRQQSTLSHNTNIHSKYLSSSGAIRLSGIQYKKGFHIISPQAEEVIQSDLSVELAIPIIFMQKNSLRIHLIVDDKYFEVTDLMRSNIKLPDHETHNAFLDLLRRENVSEQGVASLFRQELLQYTGTFTFDLSGFEVGAHQLQFVVTLLGSADVSSVGGGDAEELVLSFDAVRVHRTQ